MIWVNLGRIRILGPEKTSNVCTKEVSVGEIVCVCVCVCVCVYKVITSTV